MALGGYGRNVCEDLVGWADRTPEAAFLCERRRGVWATLTYRNAYEGARRIGAALLDSGATAAAPLGILAANGLDHALLTLAALYAGIPVSPLSVGYAAQDADPQRLRDVLTALAPGLLYASDAAIAARLRAVTDVPLVTNVALLSGDPGRADAAYRRTDADGVAKIMFTSGSTGAPKGVVTTQRMLCSNQAMLALVWPELRAARPVVVDWLPWSHCYGGSHNFGYVLHNGGSLYIDEGRPLPGAFAASLRNLAAFPPSIYFNVPRGFAMLVEALRSEPAFAATFFSRLRVMCNGGASLPAALRHELIALARQYAPHAVRVVSCWGATETAPLATTSWETTPADDDTIGTPVPGVEIKLAPSAGRTEIRVRAPSVTPGYWRDAAATAAAFDAEGFYKTGDAARLKDPAEPQRGLVFEGRLGENFKLTSGTWVNAGALRQALLERGAPYIDEIVIAGHDRDELTALVFMNRANAFATDAAVRTFVGDVLAQHNAARPASSTRIARALVVAGSPQRGTGEVTDKGTINNGHALERRAALVRRLYSRPPDAGVIVPALDPGG